MSVEHCPKPHGHHYTRICNSLLDDDRLSHKTVGILVRLLRRKQDWHINTAWLARQFPKGRGGLTAIRSALAEAKTLGYADLEYHRDPRTGKMCGSEWVIHECPPDKSDHRDAENLNLGKPECRETAVHNNALRITNNEKQEVKPRAREDATPPPAGGVAEAPPASAPEDDIPLEIDTSPPAVVPDEAPAPKVDISVHPWEAEVTRQQREDREVDVLIERLAPDRRTALEALARNRVSQQARGRRDFVTSGAVRAEMRRLVMLARARKSPAQAEARPPVLNGNGTALRVTLRWCRVCQQAQPAREVPAGLACETCQTLFDPQEATP